VYPTLRLVERRTVDRIRRARRRLGLSQEELAEASGVSAATIVQVELGNRQPQGRTLRKLAAALGVEVADLLVEEEAHPKAESRSSLEPSLFNGVEEERRIAIDYDACRTALESFCDHWQPALSGKRRLDYQGFQDFKADAASLSRLTRELMGAEMTELGQQYDEEGDPVFYTERSEFGPAVMRFHDLAIRMDKIGKESFDEDLTSDPEMGQLLDLFPKAS
jgi:transcriptional regulator with XRE-family HTH domain